VPGGSCSRASGGPGRAFAGDQAAAGTDRRMRGHLWIRRPNGGPVQGVRGRAIWADPGMLRVL